MRQTKIVKEFETELVFTFCRGWRKRNTTYITWDCVSGEGGARSIAASYTITRKAIIPRALPIAPP